MTKHIVISRLASGAFNVSFPKAKALIDGFRTAFPDAKFVTDAGWIVPKGDAKRGDLLKAWADQAEAFVVKGLADAKAKPVVGKGGYLTFDADNGVYVLRGYSRNLPHVMHMVGGLFRKDEEDIRWEVSVLDGEALRPYIPILDGYMPEAWAKEAAKREKAAKKA